MIPSRYYVPGRWLVRFILTRYSNGKSTRHLGPKALQGAVWDITLRTAVICFGLFASYIRRRLKITLCLERFTHKPQADAPARDTIGCLRFRSRTLGLVIRNDMDGVRCKRLWSPTCRSRWLNSTTFATSISIRLCVETKSRIITFRIWREFLRCSCLLC